MAARTDPITADAPLHLRLLAWMDERFPPVTYTLLVGVFGVAGLAVGWSTGGEAGGWAALVVVWLFFLHIRVFDEHKDYDSDVIAYPDRVLSRGVVTLALLSRVGRLAVVVEAVLATLLGVPALIAWVVSYVYSVLMRVEFGIGAWLSRRIVLYAVSHNPVMAGLAVFLILATGAPLTPAAWAFATLSCLGMLGFEFGRKTRRPEEEIAGVPSYTSELGQAAARALVFAVHTATAAAIAATLLALGRSWGVAAGVGACAAIPGWATAVGRQPAKRVELGSSLVLLLGFGLVALFAGAVP